MAITRFFLVTSFYDYPVFKEQKSFEALAPSKLNKQAVNVTVRKDCVPIAFTAISLERR